MKRLLMGLAVLPFIAGVAGAAQPLTNQQMDRVTAGWGFFASSTAGANGIAGPGGAVLTATGSLAAVKALISIPVGGITVTGYSSYSNSGSSSLSLTP